MWIKSTIYDDRYGLDNHIKNPTVQNIKPTCWACYFADLTKKVKKTINDTKSMTKQLQIKA